MRVIPRYPDPSTLSEQEIIEYIGVMEATLIQEWEEVTVDDIDYYWHFRRKLTSLQDIKADIWHQLHSHSISNVSPDES